MTSPPDRLLVLSETMRSLAEATADPRRLLETIARRAAEALGAFCACSLVSEDGRSLVTEETHDADPIALALLRRLASEHPLPLDPSSSTARVLAAGDPVIVDTPTDEMRPARHPRAEDRAAVVALDVRSVMLVPMRVRGASIGALSLSRHGPGTRVFDEDDVRFARMIADHAALAIAQSRLLEATREALAARERSQSLEASERRLAEASRLKSEFLANMSHELRTPLNAIIGFTTLLHAGKAGALSELQVEYLGDILGSSRHLLQLINDVLDLAKIEAGRLELVVAPVDVAKLVGEVRDVIRGLAAEKRIRLAIEIDPALPAVEADPRQLKQIVYNYLSNAIKFTSDAGRVVVRARRGPVDSFRIEVEDTGIGIREADLGRLFIEFQQLESGSTKRYAGTGLGLALTKRLVEAHGGSVGVESVLGQGSTFFAVLPIRAPVRK